MTSSLGFPPRSGNRADDDVAGSEAAESGAPEPRTTAPAHDPAAGEGLAETEERFTGRLPKGSRLGEGIAVVRALLRTLPRSPGVYRMLDEKGQVLYVGKARNLRARVTSYTRVGGLTIRIQRMVASCHNLEIITTHTEAEALLLESNLIKRYLPPFNVLLRDDKSFPSIVITGDEKWPQIAKHRGARTRKGDYFGPFASAGAVAETIAVLERAFLLRSCPDTVFASRTRPCLLYQIKRCSGPCAGRIGEADYGRLVADAKAFLSGRSREVQTKLAGEMQRASDGQDYEAAAAYRDRIRALTQIQSHQAINVSDIAEADAIAAYADGGEACVQVFFFRGGHNYGNRSYYPTHTRNVDIAEVLSAFVGQFYASRPAPKLVLLSHRIENQHMVAEALALSSGHKVELTAPARGTKRTLVDHALNNAREALARRLQESAKQLALLDGLAETLGLDAPPQRIEVYDNSHVQGKHAVGAMIVAGPDGFMPQAYRKFTIKTAHPAAGNHCETVPDGESAITALPTITPGDDYGMMREVLTRRFARALKEDPERQRGSWPDLAIVDGGAGQLHVAETVLADLGIADLPLLAIAKGPDRNAGRETFFMPGRAEFSLPARDPVLYFLQRLRDEAHRFAIGAHRDKRSKAIGQSPLDEVAGIGAKRKRALLHHFGSAQAVARAGLADLETVEGIDKAVARRIYDRFHGER